MICSDGLSNNVSNDEIAVILSDNYTAGDITKALVNAAKQRGGTDNITAVAVILGENDG